ncbi:sensor histidine kinase [Paenibacillus sp. HJGM_3]|uniref:cache domain-containing sensor histidine kinase n=1 Tax=Paenibacillus sp. HJGM_3 TaxID=3379816 RepID=UPI00385CC6EB
MLRSLRSLSLGTKQFLLLFCVTFTMFAFLAVNNYNRSAELFKNQIVDDAQMLMLRTNQFLDTYLDNGQNILLVLSSQTDMLKSSPDTEVENFLRSVSENNSMIVKTLYVIRDDGKVFSSSQVFYEVLGNPMLPRLYDQAQKGYVSIVSQPYVSPQSGQTVAIARPLVDKKNQRAGVAVVELDLNKVNSEITDVNTANQTFVLLSDKNELVTYDNQTDLLPAKPHEYQTVLTDEFVEAVIALPVGTSHIEGPQGPLVTIRSGQNRLGWTLVFFIKESYFYQNIAALNENYRTAAIVMLAVLLLAAFTISRFFTRPIRLLASRMDRVQDMAVVPNITLHRDDEIGRLARSFNAMMERIRGLLDETKRMEARKKELELKVLQSQIAPHFLYNTLACIGSLAIQHKTAEVKETIRALVGVLKFSFDKTAEFVRVDEELEGLHHYLQIQKTRYGDMFSPTLEVDPAVYDCVMLKLTLQPIVENAIFHGILPLQREGRLVIRGVVRNGVIRFTIRDNGVGMEPERLRMVLEQRITKLSKERFTGIGVHNVHDRLRLYYGKPYGMRIRSLEGAGTVVSIAFPATKADRQPDEQANAASM